MSGVSTVHEPLLIEYVASFNGRYLPVSAGRLGALMARGTAIMIQHATSLRRGTLRSIKVSFIGCASQASGRRSDKGAFPMESVLGTGLCTDDGRREVGHEHDCGEERARRSHKHQTRDPSD